MSGSTAQGLTGLQFASGLGLFFLIIATVVLILCIVLFFKVWGMTNDVSKIKDMLQDWLDIEYPITNQKDEKEQVKSAMDIDQTPKV